MSRPPRLTSSSPPGCSGGVFDWDAALRRLHELDARAEDPTLWDRPADAQTLMRERTRLSGQVEAVRGLERDLADALGYAEMAEEEGDEDSLEEARGQLKALKERAARAELEALKVPKRILVVPGIPRGDAGKPNLQSVRDLLTSLMQRQTVDIPLISDDLERQLLDLAALVFGVSPQSLSPSSSPESVEGWDSFKHVNLVLQTEDLFSIRIPGSAITKIKTLGDLIGLIRQIRTKR